MSKVVKGFIRLFVVLLISGGIYAYFYYKSEPSRYNQQALEQIKLPKGLSAKGNIYCEESRIAWHELFNFLYEHPEYRKLNLEKFNGVYAAEHDYMLMKSKDELFERFKIYDKDEQKSLSDFGLKCLGVNMKCYEKYFEEKP